MKAAEWRNRFGLPPSRKALNRLHELTKKAGPDVVEWLLARVDTMLFDTEEQRAEWMIAQLEQVYYA